MIKIEALHVEMGDFVLKDISLTIADGEYFIILGPTGAGKTVLLESIAGLNPIKSGRIWLSGRDITDLKPEKRGVSIVYQDHALFPHLSVKDNILFGLKMRKSPARDLAARQDWLVGLLNISHLLKRKPHTLSGGERQKVALARALSIRPEVLLLDEPLSALDPETREALQGELYKLHRVLKNTIIHVTHDFEEAMALGTRVAVIGEGRLRQLGTPDEIFRHPQSPFVARFALTRNVFPGEGTQVDGKAIFRMSGADIIVESDIKGQCYAAIRPEDVLISSQSFPAGVPNTFSGFVTGITDKGAVINITVNLPPNVICLVTRNQFLRYGIKTGDQVFVSLKPSSIHLFKD